MGKSENIGIKAAIGLRNLKLTSFLAAAKRARGRRARNRLAIEYKEGLTASTGK